MLWFTADFHFFHTNIIAYCGRPFTDVEAMNEALIACFNDRVAPEDEVFILGDLGFGKATIDCTARLHGHKILVAGNHDRRFNTNKLLRGVAEVHRQPLAVTLDGCRLWLCHDPAQRRPDRWTLVGHVHELWKVKPGMVNVGVDVWDFAPVSWPQVRALMATGVMVEDEY